MIKRILFLTFILFLSVYKLFATDISVLDTANFEQRKLIAKDIELRNKQHIALLGKTYKGNELKYAMPIYTRVNKYINESILKGDYIFYGLFDSIINQTHTRLLQANDILSSDSRYFVSRDISLNAMSMFFDTYVINLGTFFYMKSIDGFAAIVAHEHAHNYLKHQVQSIKNDYNVNKNVARSAFNELAKQKYGRGTKALDKYKSLMYSNGKINRQHEFEADSLGYIFYKNAGYNADEYLNSFRLMLRYDTIKGGDLDTAIYRKMFDLPQQPFKNEWMKIEDFSGYNYTKIADKLHRDSIKSHPELDERIDNLIRLFPELANTKQMDSVHVDVAYTNVRRTAFYELFQSLDIGEDYGFGVYACLSELADAEHYTDEQNKFYRYWLGKYFSKIYQARKNYTLNRSLDKVDPKEHSLGYQQFLSFMWNLKLSEIEAIAKHYSSSALE